jgi:hypothetical protein
MPVPPASPGLSPIAAPVAEDTALPRTTITAAQVARELDTVLDVLDMEDADEQGFPPPELGNDGHCKRKAVDSDEGCEYSVAVAPMPRPPPKRQKPPPGGMETSAHHHQPPPHRLRSSGRSFSVVGTTNNAISAIGGGGGSSFRPPSQASRCSSVASNPVSEPSEAHVTLGDAELVTGRPDDDDEQGSRNALPAELLCCLTHVLMADPVVAADGYTYDRRAIETWLRVHKTSPVTKAVMPCLLIPNMQVKARLVEYCQVHRRAPAPPGPSPVGNGDREEGQEGRDSVCSALDDAVYVGHEAIAGGNQRSAALLVGPTQLDVAGGKPIQPRWTRQPLRLMAGAATAVTAATTAQPARKMRGGRSGGVGGSSLPALKKVSKRSNVGLGEGQGILAQVRNGARQVGTGR